ncbi:predicted protein [Plenodomus lingam JN3]|uniref:Predicted protein n=1 Tax=Leptosphaeria maculans (strain JN3 / isolate v23.1.3 / race Av1-4-5-6-7-8) TaxID=985895 RepID=E5A9B9_LEPMJ|nr:predicted protein [Plenodomus lingam JN3]CBY00260.1 predicted protein [Plenodomus lingam JN3]
MKHHHLAGFQPPVPAAPLPRPLSSMMPYITSTGHAGSAASA